MDIERTIEFLDCPTSPHCEQRAQFANDMSEPRAVLLDLANTQTRTNEMSVNAGRASR